MVKAGRRREGERFVYATALLLCTTILAWIRVKPAVTEVLAIMPRP